MGKRQPRDIHYRFSQLLTEEQVKALTKQHATDQVLQIEVPEPKPEQVFDNRQVENQYPKVEMPQQKLDESPIEKIELPKEKTSKTEKTQKTKATDCMDEMAKLTQRIIDLEQKTNPEKVQDAARLNMPETENIDLETVQTKIKVTKVIKQLQASDVDDRGKILMLAKEGYFKDKWHPLKNVVKAFEERPWTANANAIQKELADMGKEGLLAVKKSSNRQFLYTLNANIEFIEA